MLAQPRRQAAHAGGARGKPRRRTRLADLALGRMLQVLEQFHRLQMRLFRDLASLANAVCGTSIRSSSSSHSAVVRLGAISRMRS